MNKEEFKLEPGDVVQLDPLKHLGPSDGFFAGCFMYVNEVKSWGAVGFVFVPGNRGRAPERAYYRAKWEEMEIIGKAVWLVKEENERESSSVQSHSPAL